MGNDTDIEYENDFTCPQLWERLVIGADGTVMMCSNDEFEQNKLGNVNDDSIYEIWHGKKLNEIRKIHIKHMGTSEISACKNCYLPRKTKRDLDNVDGRQIGIDNYVNRTQTVGK